MDCFAGDIRCRFVSSLCPLVISSRNDGRFNKEALRTIQDMSLRERAVFAPLVFMTLLLGVYPVLALDLIGPSVQSLIDNYNSALSIAGIDGNTMIASH